MCQKCEQRIDALMADVTDGKAHMVSEEEFAAMTNEDRVVLTVDLFKQALGLEGFRLTTSMQMTADGQVQFVIGVGHPDRPDRILPIASMTDRQIRDTLTQYVAIKTGKADN